jgi:hypothetical protein
MTTMLTRLLLVSLKAMERENDTKTTEIESVLIVVAEWMAILACSVAPAGVKTSRLQFQASPYLSWFISFRKMS